MIQTQLQQLMDPAAGEQLQPEAFQPSSQSSKHTGSEGLGGAAVPRAEDSRGVAAPLGLALPSLEPAGGFPRPPSDDCPEEAEEQREDEGAYDCTLSWSQDTNLWASSRGAGAATVGRDCVRLCAQKVLLQVFYFCQYYLL